MRSCGDNSHKSARFRTGQSELQFDGGLCRHFPDEHPSQLAYRSKSKCGGDLLCGRIRTGNIPKHGSAHVFQQLSNDALGDVGRTSRHRPEVGGSTARANHSEAFVRRNRKRMRCQHIQPCRSVSAECRSVQRITFSDRLIRRQRRHLFAGRTFPAMKVPFTQETQLFVDQPPFRRRIQFDAVHTAVAQVVQALLHQQCPDAATTKIRMHQHHANPGEVRAIGCRRDCTDKPIGGIRGEATVRFI